VRSSYGAEGTYDSSLLAQSRNSAPGELLAAAGMLGTDGYIQEAPFQRGPVDRPSNVHSQNGLLASSTINAARCALRAHQRLQRSRHNGTPYQTNATRLWRYATGGDWSGQHKRRYILAPPLRFDEHYRQTFSSISNTPNAANPLAPIAAARLPRVLLRPTNELGAVAHWNQPLGAGLLFVAGADSHDVRVWDREQTFGKPPPPSPTSTTISATPPPTPSHVGPPRMDRDRLRPPRLVQNYDGQQLHVDRLDLGAQLATSRYAIASASSIRASASRASSASIGRSRPPVFAPFARPRPTSSTAPRRSATSSRCPTAICSASAPPAGKPVLPLERHWGTIRASYFLTQVNRPIVAVTINPNSSPILLMRENLGQIESRGVSLDYELAPACAGWPSTAATSTPTPLSPAARSTLRQLDSRGRAQPGHAQPPRFSPALGTLNLQAA
jgi:hypothetical protein